MTRPSIVVVFLGLAAIHPLGCGGQTSAHLGSTDAIGTGGSTVGAGGGVAGGSVGGAGTGATMGAGGAGAGGSGGSEGAGKAGSGGTPIAAMPFASCLDQGLGRGHDCGAEGTLDCCASNQVPGGTFNRKAMLDGQVSYGDFPATIGAYRLDVLEVTVGRFRAFVDSYPTSRPVLGSGAHPKIPGSGWPQRWNAAMPPTQEVLRKFLNCVPLGIPEAVTWTDTPGSFERSPMSCMSLLLAAAFCYWDGGRLPTFAEWQFAALGGDEQRTFPWGAAPPDASLAVVEAGVDGGYLVAGSAPAGAGRWGQRDLLGSRRELVLDAAHTPPPMPLVGGWMKVPVPCADCAVLIDPPSPPYKTETHVIVDRSAYFHQAPKNDWEAGGLYMLGADGEDDGPTYTFQGLRCARDP